MKRLVWVAVLAVACSKTAPPSIPMPAPVPLPVPESAPAPPPAPEPEPASPRDKARLALKNKDPKALLDAADADPLVAPWLRLRAAELSKNKDEAIATLQRIIQQTPASSAATTARIRLAALVPEAYTDTTTIPIDDFTEEIGRAHV